MSSTSKTSSRSTGSKRKAAPTKKEAPDAKLMKRLGPNPTLKQLEQMTKTMVKFTEAVDTLKDTLESRVTEVDEHCEVQLATLEQQTQAQTEKMANLNREFDQKYNDERIKTEQDIREFGLKKATEIAERNGKVLVDKERIQTLETRVEELELALSTQEKTIRESMVKIHEEALKAQEARLNLEKEKDTAEINGQKKSAEGEIKILREQLKHAHSEVAACRELVSTTVTARSAQPIMMQAPMRDNSGTR